MFDIVTLRVEQENKQTQMQIRCNSKVFMIKQKGVQALKQGEGRQGSKTGKIGASTLHSHVVHK